MCPQILRILLLGGFLWIFTHPAVCQNQRIQGKVFDAATLEPLSFAKVTFLKGEKAVFTDEEGNYVIYSRERMDSLTASFLGYRDLTLAVPAGNKTLDFGLSASDFILNEVVIVPDERGNPAHPIIRKAIANKPINDRSRFEAYEFESYEKIEIDINNFDEKVRKQLIFKPIPFVFDYVDTTGGNPYLPMFLTETLKDVYYRKAPRATKEWIKATQTSGVNNTGFSQLINSVYQQVNPYDNNMILFEKSFVSPISEAGFKFYRYYLMDSLKVGEHFCYKIHFRPKRKQELTLKGDIYLTMETYAVKKLEADMTPDANLNYITGFQVLQVNEEVGPGSWMPVNEYVVATLNVFIPHEARSQEFLAKKSSSFRSFKLNRPREDAFYSSQNLTEVAADANEKPVAFWEASRHDTLSQREMAVYTMVDSIKQAPFYKLVRTMVLGYADFGLFEIGPLFTVYSFNPIEGSRLKLGGRTTKRFNRNAFISGYVAYGFLDERVKYSLGLEQLVSQKPRQILRLGFSHDVEQLGRSRNTFRNDNILASIFRINPATKLNRVPTIWAGFEHEWFAGFSTRLDGIWRVLYPLGDITYIKPGATGQETVVSKITTTELVFSAQFAWKEKFVDNTLHRISLGTRFPILNLQYTLGLEDVFRSDYRYHKLALGMRQKFRMGRAGRLKYWVEAGKIWGQIPYPLLEVHTGNETFFYDEQAYNSMNFFEFVSDQYASLSIAYHMEGWILNKIPLMRKLKWREVFSAKALVGSLTDANRQEMILPDFIHPLDRGPFAEASVGIENIFRFLRVDALWRLTYLDHPNIQPFGVKFRVEVAF